VGPQGATGATGISTITFVSSAASTFTGSAAVGATVNATATCATGKAIGGGADITGNSAANAIAVLIQTKPSSATAWTATATEVVHASNGSPPSLVAWVVCAS